MKAAIFHPTAIAAIRLFPGEVRRELGKAIFDLQKGEALAMPCHGPCLRFAQVFPSSEFATKVESIVFFTIVNHLEAFSCFTHS